MKLSCCLLAAGILLSACASAPMASGDRDNEAKKFVPVAGTASLYVARRSEMFGMLIPFKVAVDGKDGGTLAQGAYQMFSVKPGQHRVEISTGLNSTVLNVEVSAGTNSFYSTGAKAGTAIIEPEIAIVPLEPMGKFMISQSTRAPIVE